MNIRLSDHFNYKKLLQFTLPSIIMMIFTSIYGVVDGLLAHPFASVFVGYDLELLELTRQGFRIYSFSFLFAGIAVYGSSFFTALGNGLISALISFLRTLLFQAAAVLIFPLIWGINGIWLSITAAELMAAVVTILFIIGKRSKYHY